MVKNMRMFLVVLVAVPIAAVAQNFAGNYSLQDPEGITTMAIQQDAGGNVNGTITESDGTTINLHGEIKGNGAIGFAMAGEKSILFKLHFQGTQLVFTMIPMAEDANPDMAKAQRFTFTRASGSWDESSNPLGNNRGKAAGDPLVGTYSDNNMKLQLDGGSGKYLGEIQFKGQSFPASAQSSDGRTLKGKFMSGADSYEFTGSLQGATLTFITGGTTYQLRRQGGAPAAATNPMSGGGRKPVSAASQASAAKPIAGGQVVNDPSMGVRFSVPPGWKHQKQQANYIMGHDTIPGMIIVMPHTSNSIQELSAAANEPLYQAQDGQLMVTASPVNISSNMIAADYGGHLQGKQAQGRIVGVVSPFGGGFLIMAGTDSSNYGPQYAQLAEGIARSMSFSKPQLPPEAGMWKQKLTGMRVKYFKHGGSSDAGGAYSWSDERDIDICSDGTFQSVGGFQGSLGTAGGSAIMNPGKQAQSGQWAITGQSGQPALQLRHASGNVETFILSTDGSKTFLDGVRWYVIENPTCQ